MQDKEEIKLRRGKITQLAKDCSVSIKTVRAALKWGADSDTQNFVRYMARKNKYIRKF